MYSGWRRYLQSAGATIENDAVSHFGDPGGELRAVQTGTILCDLAQFGLLYFRGPDSRAFLHGQLSSDVQNLGTTAAQYSSYCSPKGRVLASLLLWQATDGFFAQLHAGLSEDIRNRLTKFILSSKVRITDAGDTHVCLGVAGRNAEMLAKNCFGAIPQSMLGVKHHESATLIRISPDRFQIICDAQQAPALWEQLRQNTTPVGTACWDWLSIRSGIAVIAPATKEQFVPQMLNMEIVGAVSFSKGCYPGQEIVARAQHLGTLKRRMYLANILSDAAPQAADELFGANGNGQTSGTVVNGAASPEGGYDVLAVIQIAAAGKNLHWKSPDGPVIKLLPLPYSV